MPAATIIILIIPLLLRVICIWYPWPLGLHLSKRGMKSSNAFTDPSESYVREGKTGADKFAQAFAQENWKSQLACVA